MSQSVAERDERALLLASSSQVISSLCVDGCEGGVCVLMHDVNVVYVSVTDVASLDVLVRAIEIAPPSVDLHCSNELSDSDVPPILRVFPSSSVAEIAAPPP